MLSPNAMLLSIDFLSSGCCLDGPKQWSKIMGQTDTLLHFHHRLVTGSETTLNVLVVYERVAPLCPCVSTCCIHVNMMHTDNIAVVNILTIRSH